MRLRTQFFISAALLGCCGSLQAQQKWNLLQCVEYAQANNVGIKLATIPVGNAELQVKQDKLAQYPTANLGNSYGMSFGRRENPTTGVFEDQRFFNIGLNFQTSVTIFNWFSRKNIQAANVLELQAANVSVDKLKNDIALTVANQYLNVLLSVEQKKIAQVQLQQTKLQLATTLKKVAVGDLPQLNAAELEAQLARDSFNVVSADGSIQQNLLTLKATLNLDAAAPFDIETPPVDKIPVDPIASLQPEAVFGSAVQNLPQQQFNNIKYKAAEKQRKAAWGAMRPTISAFGGMGTNFVYFRTPIYEQQSLGLQPTGLIVNNGGTTLPVLAERFAATDKVSRYFTPKRLFPQFGDNFGQNIGLSINVPIFNGGNLRMAYQRSKINLKNWELLKEQDNQKLKQDIYQAYNAAVVAMEKFNSTKRTVETAERSFGFAQKRHDAGFLPTYDLIVIQNNLFRERLQHALNQFDYVFKMKVLEFYKGQGIKL
jgi:outer membrane protein